jgi:hypothetical protein
MISNGTLLVAMILNGLGFVSRTLHMQAVSGNANDSETFTAKS